MNQENFFNRFFKLDKQKNYGDMCESERFEEIYLQKASKEVFEYLSNHFQNLKIEILGDYEGNIMELMEKGVLIGWCWETTETAILFLDDDSYIERGNLKFEKNKYYYHSWIVFNFNEVDYVFDPCLQILYKKDIYDKIFETEVKGRVTAKQVREYFINYITNPPKKELTKEKEERAQQIHQWLVSLIGENAFERSKGEIVVYDKEDVNAPMYRNGVGYKTTLENENENIKIKKLVAHYYM